MLLHRFLLLTQLLLATSLASAVEQPLVFPDSNLENELRITLGISPGDPIYPSSLTTLSQLDLSDKNIVDLTGLEHAVNLTHLNLSQNEIELIAPLSALSQLVELDLSNNNIGQVPNDLAGLTQLQTLLIQSNPFYASGEQAISFYKACPFYAAYWNRPENDCDFDQDGTSNYHELQVGFNFYQASSHPMYRAMENSSGFTQPLDLATVIAEIAAEDGTSSETADGWNLLQEDFDNDGDMDWVVYFLGISEQREDLTCNYDCGEDYSGSEYGKLAVFENNNGQYQRVALADDRPYGDVVRLQSFDANNDGYRDLLALFTREDRLYISEPNEGSNGFQLVDRTAEFGLPDRYGAYTIADIDDDGFPDLVSFGNTPQILRYVPDVGEDGVYGSKGTYQDISSSITLNDSGFYSLAAYDVDLDSDIDFIAYSNRKTIHWIRNDGNLTFTAVDLGIPTDNNDDLRNYYIRSLLVSDVNGDGYSDFAVIENVRKRMSTEWWADYDYEGYRIRIFENQLANSSTPDFAEAWSFVDTEQLFTNGGNFIDFDTDGDPDLIVSDYEADHSLVFRNDGNQTWFPYHSRLGYTGRTNKIPLATDFNQDGSLDLAFPGGSRNGMSAYAFETYEPNNHYFRVRLVGADSGKDAIGANLFFYNPTTGQLQGISTHHQFGHSKDIWVAADQLQTTPNLYISWPNAQLTAHPIESVTPGELLTFHEPIAFSDFRLESKLKAVLGIATADKIYESDLLNLQSLDLSGLSISNLDGLHHARNLQELNLANNRLSQVDQLSYLTQLQRVDLTGNPLTASATQDSDGDGAPDLDEQRWKTNPHFAGSYPQFQLARNLPAEHLFADVGSLITTQLQAQDISTTGLSDTLHPYLEDLDQDGDMDLAVFIPGQSGNAGALMVFENISAVLTPSLTSQISGDFISLFAADFDQEGDRDLILLTTNTFKVFENHQSSGDALALTDATSTLGLGSITSGKSVEFIDSDKDGKFELLLLADSLALFEYNPFTHQYVDQTATTGLPIVTEQTSKLVTLDVDQDSYTDVLLVDYTTEASLLKFFRNGGNGSFSELPNDGMSYLQSGEAVLDITVFDSNRDNQSDLLLTLGTFPEPGGIPSPAEDFKARILLNSSTEVSVSLESIADIQLTAATALSEDQLGTIALDVDNDGDQDILVAAAKGDTSTLLINNGNHSFTPSDISGIEESLVYLPQYFDNDNDGRLDLVAGTQDGTYQVYLYANLQHTNHSLGFKLLGKTWQQDAYLDAYGSQVQLDIAGSNLLETVAPGYKQNLALHFGLGNFGLGDGTQFNASNLQVLWQNDVISNPQVAELNKVYTLFSKEVIDYLPVTRSLVSSYDFSSGSGTRAIDQTGSSTLNLTGAESWLTDRNGFSFQGSNSFAGGDPSSIEDYFADESLSFDIWFNVAASHSGPVFEIKDSAASRFILHYQLGTSQYLLFNLDGNGYYYYFNTPEGVQHLALVNTTHGSELYVNGSLVSTEPIVYSYHPGSTDYPITIGSYFNLADFWTGDLYQLNFYSDALSADEIVRNYRTGSDPHNNDEDGDGVRDSLDGAPLNPSIQFDHDNDGIDNSVDMDDDNDGVSDLNDQFPTDSQQVTDENLSDLIHLIKRTSFGMSNTAINEAARLGLQGYIDQQLNPDTITEVGYTPQPAEFVLDSSVSDTVQLRRMRWDLMRRQAHSRKQLLEVMTQFWENHFSTYWNKHQVTSAEYNDQVKFRENALNKFGALLLDNAKSPAMLVYLDNYTNRSVNDEGEYITPNENYARELLELHTVSIYDENGSRNYSGTDIVNTAHILAGWSVTEYDKGDVMGDFVFKPEYHRNWGRRVMGSYFSQTDMAKGEALLAFLATHPSTANFICKKLIEVFVADETDAAVIASETQTLWDNCKTDYLASEGDMTVILSNLLRAPEFYSDTIKQAKVKTPLEHFVSASRAFNVQDHTLESGSPAGIRHADYLDYSGMPLYYLGPPDGYPEVGGEWIGTNNYMQKARFGFEAAFDTNDPDDQLSVPILDTIADHGLKTDQEILNYLILTAVGNQISDLERNRLNDILNPPNEPKFVLSASFAEARLQRLVATMLTMPSFQFQ